MTPFFFGESKNQLYGVLHPMQGTAKKPASVLLCNAFGQEYMRSHRALRQLAVMLSKQGYDVLRFDYRGTGDSALELDEVDAQDWKDDITIAIDELKDISAVQSVHVIGLRLGGLLAAAACAEREDIESLNLWDAIGSGDQYINELRDELSDKKAANDNGVLNSNYQEDSGVIHFNGFALNNQNQKKLNEMNIANIDLSAINKIRHIISHKSDESQALIQAMNTCENFESYFIEAPHDWNYIDKYGGILLPQPIIQGIVNSLK